MIKKICLIISCLISITCRPLESKEVENVDSQNRSEALLKASHRYLDFINLITAGEAFPAMENASTLFSPDCKKVLNGQLFTENREDFVADLLSVYENQGAWKVCLADILIAPSNHMVVLRLFIEMENFGTYTAIVILRYNSSYLITEINEVLSQIKGSYDF